MHLLFNALQCCHLYIEKSWSGSLMCAHVLGVEWVDHRPQHLQWSGSVMSSGNDVVVVVA
jgi:hypothetical protein